MKRWIKAVLIIVSVISFIIPPFCSFALVREGEGEAALLQEGEFDVVDGESVKHFANNAKSSSAEEFLYNQLLSFPESIDLSAYRVSADTFSAFYSNVINDNPDLFYVSSSYQYNYYPSNNTVANVYPEYSMTSEEIAEAKIIFNKGRDKALSRIDSSMTDVQKAVVLHDYVCSLAHYPNVDLNTEDKGIYHSAYGLFYDGEVVCAGYTLAYSYLMNLAGVQCEYVSSDPMTHAWNKAYIDGSWYNIDCTFDDIDFESSISLIGSEGHMHFLKSDSKFTTQECSFHYGGETLDDCTANSTLYDNAFWNDIYSNIYAVDGEFYYLKPDYTNKKVTFTKRTVSGAETDLSVFSNSISFSGSSTVFDSDGNQYTNTHRDALARLTYLDSRFYMNVGKTIYSFCLPSRRYNIVGISQYSMGLGVDDKYNLIYQHYDTPDTLRKIDKTEYYNNYFTTVKSQNYNNYPDINIDGVINAKDYAMIRAQNK